MIFGHNKSLIMTTVYIKEIPKDLVCFILKMQGEIKSQKGIGKYSQSQTILHIIKEYKKITEK